MRSLDMLDFIALVKCRRWSSDAGHVEIGANFRIDKHTIVDVGLNLGLNKAAPKAQVYSGISFRF